MCYTWANAFQLGLATWLLWALIGTVCIAPIIAAIGTLSLLHLLRSVADHSVVLSSYLRTCIYRGLRNKSPQVMTRGYSEACRLYH